MFRKIAVLTLVLASLTLVGCVSEDKTERALKAPAAPPDIFYGSGFFDLEVNGNLTWRWMGPVGVVRLKNTGKDMLLRIEGRAPVERFKQAPVITISLNGTELDQAKATEEPLTREFTITAAQQGSQEWSELKISCDKSFVPKDTDPGATDSRRLAFSLTSLSWRAQ